MVNQPKTCLNRFPLEIIHELNIVYQEILIIYLMIDDLWLTQYKLWGIDK